MYWNQCIFNDSRLPMLPTPPKKWFKMCGIYTFSVILGLHASHSTEEIMENVGKSMHLQWFLASHASHSTGEIMEHFVEIDTFSMNLDFPRFPVHRRNHETCVKSLHFEWFWASHASPSTEEIMNKLYKSMNSEWFWVSHAFHSTEEIMNMYGSIHF